MIARRLSAYLGVQGLLCARHEDAVELEIVAPPPMTAPLRLLVSTWQEELRSLCPACSWQTRVSPSPPGNADDYQCIFWRDR